MTTERKTPGELLKGLRLKPPTSLRRHYIVSFGGGTNSTAMLIGMHERNWRPDAIVFADTGGEKPETYAHIKEMQEWLTKVGFPKIDVLRGKPWWTPQMVVDGSLEQQCLRLGVMPSKAYGGSTCSIKWKVEPQDKYNKAYCTKHGVTLGQITRLIGFDAGEPSRVTRAKALAAEKNRAYKEEYPLSDWGWARVECVAAIDRAGITRPGKSACFFCPSMKKHEILALKNTYPSLYGRAIEIERKALSDEGDGQMEAARCAGLGRSFNWRDYVVSVVAGETAAPKPFDSRYCEPFCDTCYDG